MITCFTYFLALSPPMHEYLKYIPFYDHLINVAIVWVILLVVFRFSNFFKLKACPSCGGELKRSRKDNWEKYITIGSIGLLPIKTYRCYKCNWKGHAFPSSIERKYNPKKLRHDDPDSHVEVNHEDQ